MYFCFYFSVQRTVYKNMWLLVWLLGNSYRVSVTTANIRDAGTNAGVYISLYGDKAQCSQTILDYRSRNDHEQGK